MATKTSKFNSNGAQFPLNTGKNFVSPVCIIGSTNIADLTSKNVEGMESASLNMAYIEKAGIDGESSYLQVTKLDAGLQWYPILKTIAPKTPVKMYMPKDLTIRKYAGSLDGWNEVTLTTVGDLLPLVKILHDMAVKVYAALDEATKESAKLTGSLKQVNAVPVYDTTGDNSAGKKSGGKVAFSPDMIK